MWTKRLSIYGLCALTSMWAVIAEGAAFTPENIQAAFERWTPAMCILSFTQAVTDPRTGEMQQHQGSAVALVVSPEGLLISNGHLQREGVSSYNFRVIMNGADETAEYPATLLSKPRDINVSFLRITSDIPLNLPFVRFVRGSSLALGEEVAILGIMGEAIDFHRGVVMNRVSAIIDAPRTAYCLEQPLKLGYITGPVVNTRGEVVGVTGFELSNAEGGDLYTRSGYPMVFQTDLFISYVDSPPGETAESGDDEEAWLGIFTQPLKEDYAAYWGIESPGGLIVSTVAPDSPAAEAGLRPGDIIRVFDGHPIRALQDRDVLAFTQLVREKAPHAAVEMEILRDGAPETVQVTLGVRPRTARDAEEYTDDTLGLIVREITRDLRILLNLGEDVQGVIVRRVVSGSPAHVARIQPGVIIMSLGNIPVANLEAFELGMNTIRETKPQEISIFARVGPTTGFFRVKPRW